MGRKDFDFYCRDIAFVLSCLKYILLRLWF